MKRHALRLVTFALSLCAAPVLLAADLGQITHLRVGGHRGYDRVVIELDRAVDVWWGVESDPRAPLFEIAAHPLRPQILDTGLNRAGVMRIEAMPAGTRIRLDPRTRRVRVFKLEDPHRVVIDFADPSSKPFPPPKGTRAVRMSQERFSAAAEGRPTPKTAATTPKTAARPERRSPFDTPPGAPQTATATRTARATPPEAPKQKPGIEPIERPTSPEQPGPLAESAAETGPASPSTATREGRASAPVTPPRPVPGAASGERPDWWLLLAAAFGLVAVLCLIYGIVRRLSATAPTEATDLYSSSSPETITPEELFREGGRIELLDKRIDEEVRARMVLEERVVQANEEVKVLRDKLARLERRR